MHDLNEQGNRLPPARSPGGHAHETANSLPQKQLAIQGLDNVRTCLALATLTIPVVMIDNSTWGLPLRNISTLATALT